jgi:hypothetical protein
MPGPPPKDPKLKMGHSTGVGDSRNSVETHSLPEAYAPKVPEVNPEWCNMAQAWFRAIDLTPMGALYTESDWMTAYIAADLLDAMLDAGWHRVGMMLAEWNRMTERLLITIGDRRRMRIDFIRAGAADADPDAAVAEDELASWRERMATKTAKYRADAAAAGKAVAS